jgi:hypothetical protein
MLSFWKVYIHIKYFLDIQLLELISKIVLKLYKRHKPHQLVCSSWMRQIVGQLIFLLCHARCTLFYFKSTHYRMRKNYAIAYFARFSPTYFKFKRYMFWLTCVILDFLINICIHTDIILFMSEWALFSAKWAIIFNNTL